MMTAAAHLFCLFNEMLIVGQLVERGDLLLEARDLVLDALKSLGSQRLLHARYERIQHILAIGDAAARVADAAAGRGHSVLGLLVTNGVL